MSSNINIRIRPKSGMPIYEQIGGQIRSLILDGILKQGDALPSIRSLASDLKISVITTKRAYEELEKDGMIYSVQGKGFFVDNPDREFLEEKRVYDVEAEMKNLIDKCMASGLSKENVIEMVDLLWGEEKC